MLSYAKGPDVPLAETTIAEALQRTVDRLGNRDALIVRHQNQRLTWVQLSSEVERVARGLAGRGLRSGDRVGIWSTNCTEWVLLHLACARIGAVLVNVNPAYRAYELSYVLRKSGMKALFLWERGQRTDYRAIFDEASTGQTLALRHIVYCGTDDWTRMLAAGTDVPEANIKANHVTNLQYTSGTTGSPKGVLLTHRNLVNNASIIASGLKITEQDKICAPVPLYHCFGCVGGTLISVVTGAALILPSPTFDPIATMNAIQTEQATVIYGVPSMFISQLEHPKFSSVDLKSLRTGVMAGAPCPTEIMKRVVGEMHCPEMTIMYGQTEASPVITMSMAGDSLERRVSTVGCACANTEVKIVSTVS